jgi:hypothetical protein
MQEDAFLHLQLTTNPHPERSAAQISLASCYAKLKEGTLERQEMLFSGLGV